MVRLMAVGDIFFGEHAVCLGHGVDSIITKRGFTFPFNHVRSLIKEADITFGNLECITSNIGRSEREFESLPLRGRPDAIQGLEDSGFNIMSLANNHAMHHGKDALLDTLRMLDAKNIKAIGVKKIENFKQPVIFEKQNIRIGFLAYCETQQYNLDEVIVELINPEKIKDDINALKNDADIIIVSLHWGDEFIDWPSTEQIKLGHSIIDMGANIILGHHPHVLQGIEKYNGGIIIYSLGSFVIDLWQIKIRESIVLDLKLSKDRIEMNLIPIFINQDYQPKVLEGEDKNRLLEQIDILSKQILDRDLTNSKATDVYYRDEVKQLLHKDKLDLLFHYIKYFPKYNYILLAQNLFGYFKRIFRRRMIH